MAKETADTILTYAGAFVGDAMFVRGLLHVSILFVLGAALHALR